MSCTCTCTSVLVLVGYMYMYNITSSCNLFTGHSIHEASEDGESLLSLACSAGYYELAEVLLRMKAQVEDRGIKGV